MSPEIESAQQAFAGARANLERVEVEQSAKISAARATFEASPNEETASTLANAERVAQLLVDRASQALADASAEVARLQTAEKQARISELEGLLSSSRSTEFFESVATRAAAARQTLLDIGLEVIAHGNETLALLRELTELRHEVSDTSDHSMYISGIRDRVRSALSVVNRLSFDEVTRDTERFAVTTYGESRARQSVPDARIALQFAFGE